MLSALDYIFEEFILVWSTKNAPQYDYGNEVWQLGLTLAFELDKWRAYSLSFFFTLDVTN